MSFVVLDKANRRHFTTTYRLAQQSLEGFTLWSVLLDPMKTQLIGQMPVISMNEDLLRIIITNTKRSFVSTMYILTDDSRYGSMGYNVYELLNRFSKLGFDNKEGMSNLTSDRTKTAIKKVKILRNNLDAHHSASDEWKKSLGEIPNSEMGFLINTVYDVIWRCNANVGLDRLTADALRTRTLTYTDRLLRALTEQFSDGLVGKEFVSVNAWEAGARYDTPEEFEAWQRKQNA
jgi:hypothetical protein